MGDEAAGDGSVATSEEMFLAVERWSRARKIRIGDYPDPARLWEVTMTRPGTVGITKRDGAGRIDPTVGTKDNALQVAPEVAVAWALAVEAGLPAVDVGPCPACVARSLPGRKLATMEWAQRDWNGFWPDPQMCQWEHTRFAVGPITGEHFEARYSYTYCRDQNANGDCDRFEAKPKPAALVVLPTPERGAAQVPKRRSALRLLASRPAASIGAATTVGCLVALALLGPLGKVAVVVGAIATATATAVFSRLGWGHG